MFDISDKESILEAFYNDDETGLSQENPENNITLAEAMFIESLNPEELESLANNPSEMATLVEEGILSEKTIVKFDKKAKLSRAESQAVLLIAKEKKDRDFNKLIRVWKMRKALLDKLEKKYSSQAKQRAKKMVKNTAKSKSSTAKKVAARANKK